MKLIGKKILITGGTSGIGLRLIEQLYQNNTLYIVARSQDKINTLLKSFPNIEAFNTDLSDIDSLQAVVKSIKQRTDNLDILVNNAAVQYTPMFTEADFCYQGISREVNTNFTSICCLCYLLLPLLNTGSPAVILNVNSGLALAPKTSSAVYCATKAALDNFSQALSNQLINTHIKVLQAFLPVVDTAMTYGRSENKITSLQAAKKIINGIESSKKSNDIGKVKLLRLLMRYLPCLGRRIMRGY